MTVPTEQLPGLVERMIRIETKLDVIHEQRQDHDARLRTLEIDNTPGGHQDHETRIRRLEKSVWIAAGFAAAGGGALGSVLGAVFGGN